ncbi:MAG: TetR/AcrR family transcriptional regulator [Phyllobacteriaceae bacterium]|nr:TetR/AcrR family transcriptional regulator [Phyllobacteriaceae bacterium]
MARVSKAAAADHRAAIVRAAGRLFRARGLDRVGVAEVTKAAGLTHGGFYGHFASKEALAVEAIAAAFAEGRTRLEADGLDAYLRGYLSRGHRDHPEEGCPLPALAAGPAPGVEVADALAAGTRTLVEAIAARLPAVDGAPDVGRALALTALAVGGQVLARMSAASDRPFSDRLLRETRALALDLADEPVRRADEARLPGLLDLDPAVPQAHEIEAPRCFDELRFPRQQCEPPVREEVAVRG